MTKETAIKLFEQKQIRSVLYKVKLFEIHLYEIIVQLR